jgi:hypothetical protein
MKVLSQVQNKVPTGTTPMTVDSTTVVANLNADQVDGAHAAGGGVALHDGWVSGHAYVVGDTTLYQDRAYICILDTSTADPLNGVYWKLMEMYGVPTGGATGAFLRKTSATPYALQWDTIATVLAALITETTYTPVVTGATTAGVGTYTVQIGRYTKIGKRVFIDVSITMTAHTGTGFLQISLPAVSENTTNFMQPLVITHVNLTLTASHVAYCQIAANTSVAVVVSSAAGASACTGVAMDGTCSIRLSGSYVANA